MSDLADLDLFTSTPATENGGSTRKCRRHEYDYRDTRCAETGLPPASCEEHSSCPLIDRCARCGKVRDEVRARRGKNNRTRGNAAELTVARSLNGRKVGPLGLPHDVEIEGYLRLQVKKLARWPSLAQIVEWIDAIPPRQDMRGAAIIQPGRGGRRLLVLDLDEFSRWHGDPTKGEAA